MNWLTRTAGYLARVVTLPAIFAVSHMAPVPVRVRGAASQTFAERMQ